MNGWHSVSCMKLDKFRFPTVREVEISSKIAEGVPLG